MNSTSDKTLELKNKEFLGRSLALPKGIRYNTGAPSHSGDWPKFKTPPQAELAS